MDLKALERLAGLGEGQHLEFKRKVPRPERIAKEVIAFANAEGGKLLLGVDDDGSVRGVRDAHEELFALERALKTHCRPPIPFEVEIIEVKHRREALVVDVAPSEDKPHYLVEDDGSKTAYVRYEDQSVLASKEAVRLMRAEKNPTNTRFEFGDKEHRLMQYLDRHERITVDQFARLADVPRRSAAQDARAASARPRAAHPPQQPRGLFHPHQLNRPAKPRTQAAIGRYTRRATGRTVRARR